jgi:hypothetical protein
MIPKVNLENLEISRFVCGTNPFVGISHFTKSHDEFFQELFSDDQKVAEIMLYMCQEFGVNACISSPRDNIAKAIESIEKETGQPYYWICTPSQRKTTPNIQEELQDQIQWCADHHVAVCMPHRSYTDNYINLAKNEIAGLPEITAAIRDLGMIPGLSTHNWETIRVVQNNKYDISLIVQPLNPVGFLCGLEVNDLARFIRNSKIQVINIKPLAAGRVLPEVGLEFCFNNIKPNDFVACGVCCIQDADYDCQIVDHLLNK